MKLYLKIIILLFVTNAFANDSDYFNKLSYRIDNALYKSMFELEVIKKEQIALYKKTNKDSYKLNADFIQALIYFNDPKKFFNSIELFLNVEKKSRTNYYLNSICNYYIALAFQNKLPKKSIFYFNRTIQLLKTHNEKQLNIAICYKTIGDIYFNKYSDFKSALNVYRKGYKYLPKEEFIHIASYYNNVSLCYEKLKLMELALKNSKKANSILKEGAIKEHYVSFIYDAKGNLARYYGEFGEFDKAETLITEIEKFYLKKENYDEILKPYSFLYYQYINKKRTDKLDNIINKINANINNIKDSKIKGDLLNVMIDYYTLKQDKIKLHYYYNIYNNLLNIINEENKEQLTTNNELLTEKIIEETESRLAKEILEEREIKLKKIIFKNYLKNIKILNQRKYLQISIAFIALILFLFIYLFVVLKKKKQIAEINNIILKELEYETRKSLIEKENFIKEIHHRVKNNFQLLMSLLNIQAKEEGLKDVKSYLEKCQTRIISMSLIHENLYQTDRLDKVDFENYINDLISQINEINNFGNQNFTYQIEIKNTFFDVQTTISLGLIVNELYSNILKHAFPNNENGIIQIILINKLDNQYQLIISDNGIGLNDDNNSKKTFGLKLINMLINQLDGMITIQNQNGTKIIIDFKDYK